MKKRKTNSLDALINDKMIEKIEKNNSIKVYGGAESGCEWIQNTSDCFHTIQDQTCKGQDQCTC